MNDRRQTPSAIRSRLGKQFYVSLKRLSDDAAFAIDKQLKVFNFMKDLSALNRMLKKMNIDEQMINIVLEIVSYDIRRSVATTDDSKFVVYTKDHNFVERLILKIPTVAPALWPDKIARDGRDPYEFKEYYYIQCLSTGLSKLHLRALDKPLYYAYWM